MLLIGIAGGSGSGKTTVVNKIVELLPRDSVAIVSQDSYYYDNGHLPQEEKEKINFDHPNSIEFDLLVNHIHQLKNGKVLSMPIYDYVTCGRTSQKNIIKPHPVVIVEGILIFSHKPLRDLMDIKIFVSADGDDRLMRIIRRDIQERGRTYEDALQHYEKFVKPMHQQFIEPTIPFADIIIPQGGQNQVAIDIVVSRIKKG